MDKKELSLEALGEAQCLLERMLELVERSAGDDCNDSQRRDMRKGFELPRGLLYDAVQRYERGWTTK